MPKGGARTRSGPAPDPNAIRPNATRGGKSDEWLSLPAAGRDGDTPEWPLPLVTPVSKWDAKQKQMVEVVTSDEAEERNGREAAMWADLWTRPQAIEWERTNLEADVALYVRRYVEASEPGSVTTLSTLVRQMGDSLGLTTPGLRANRWKIEDTPTTARQVATRRTDLRVVGEP